MIVVSDTSPLNYLILINLIEVLPGLFSEIHAPSKVLEELRRSRAPSSVKNWAKSPPSWLRIATPRLVIATTIRLDPGEMQAIALAKEIHAPTLLIDERKGRRVAQEHGLETVGTLTVLELAAERKLIVLPSALALLQQTSFRISSDLIQAALARDAARVRKT